MDKIIEKIDNYNLFTNIIPGYLMLMFNLYYFNITNLKIAEQIILSYFIGQTLSRLGSLVIGKILLRISKENGESYDKYILADDKDKKISILLQERNTYRTFCALFLCCIFEIILSKLIRFLNVPKNIIIVIIFISLFCIYAMSFCKYNKYISDRVRVATEKRNERKK